MSEQTEGAEVAMGVTAAEATAGVPRFAELAREWSWSAREIKARAAVVAARGTEGGGEDG